MLTWGQHTLHMWSYHITSKLSRSVTLQLFCDVHLHRHNLHKQANMLYTQKQAHRRTKQRRDRKLCELIIGCKDYSLWLQQRETDRQSCLVSFHTQIQARSRCLYADSGQNSQTQPIISSRPKNVYVSKQWSKMLCEVDCKNSMRGREIWRRALWLTHLSASISSFPISVSLSFAHTAGRSHAHTPSDLTAHLFRCLGLRK